MVLKIIKHYQEEGQGSEVVQGVLLGLVVEDRLEITNCFPFPQHTEDDADFDEGTSHTTARVHSQKKKKRLCRRIDRVSCRHTATLRNGKKKNAGSGMVLLDCLKSENA